MALIFNFYSTLSYLWRVTFKNTQEIALIVNSYFISILLLLFFVFLLWVSFTALWRWRWFQYFYFISILFLFPLLVYTWSTNFTVYIELPYMFVMLYYVFTAQNHTVADNWVSERVYRVKNVALSCVFT